MANTTDNTNNTNNSSNTSGGYVNDSRTDNISINRTPSKSYDSSSTLDLLVARREVNKQTQQFLDQIKNQQTMINSILKSIEQSNERGNKKLKENAKIFKESMDYALNSGEMSTSQQLDFMTLYAKILEEAGKKYILNENSTKRQVQYGNKLLAQSKEMLQNAKEYKKALEGSTDNLMTRTSKNLEKMRTKFQDVLNTLNINNISNMLSSQSLNNKMSIMNSVRQQFGLDSSGFESFKDNMLSQAQALNSNMGKSLVGSQDVYDAMQRMIDMGITDTSIAQDQLQAMLIGNKFLGQSAESQTLLYKYMKRTGDADLANKWNKTIAGLLDSQLGVSKQQLDAITSLLFSSTDTKSKMGWTEDEINNYNNSAAVLGASLSATFGNEKGKNLLSLYDQLMSTDSSDAIESLQILTGGNYDYIQSLAKAGNTNQSFQMIASAIQGWMNTVQSSGNSLAMAKTYEALNSAGIDTSLFSDFTSVVENFGKLNDNFNIATNDLNTFLASGKSIEDWVSETTDATWEEQIENASSLIIDKLPWSAITQAGNLVFGVYMVEGILGMVGKIYAWISGSSAIKGMSSLFSNFFGNNSTINKSAKNLSKEGTAGKALSGLGAGLTVVGLSAAALAGIANALDSEWQNAQVTDAQNWTEESKGNSGVASAMASNATRSYNSTTGTTSERLGNYFSGSNFAKNFGGTVVNFFTDIGNAISNGNNPTEYNKYQWTRFMRTNSGLFSRDELNDIQAAYAWALISVGQEGVLNQLWKNYNNDSLKSYLLNNTTLERMNSAFTRLSTNDLIPKNKNNEFWNGVVSFDSIPINNSDWSEDQLARWNGTGGADSYYIPTSRRGFYENFNYGMGGDGSGWTSLIHSPWYKVTSMWGNRPNPFGGGSTENHGGMDISAPSGTPIGSATSGTVYTAGWVSGFGNAVYIQGDNGMKYIYGHMVKTPSVKTGQRVTAGQLIGYVGSTGRSTGPHLHFQVGTGWTKSNSVDPVPYLNTGVLYPRKRCYSRC